MKKITLFFTLLICALGAFAHRTPANKITPQNMHAVLADLFASHPNSTPQLKKDKWQAVFFLTSDNTTWDNLNDLTNKLIAEHKKGTLQYAIVLYDRIAKDEPGFRQGENGIYLYTIGEFSPQNYQQTKDYTEGSPAYEYFFKPGLSKHEGSISDLLDTLLSHMNTHTNTYNYFRIHAHGGGINMEHYSNDTGDFTFKTIHDAIKKRNIHIDVLDIHSCMMGTAANATEILSAGNVDYLFFSSNITTTRWAKDETTLLNYLTEKPGQAARHAVEGKFLGENLDTSTTNNLILVSRQAVKTLLPFEAWFKTDYPKYQLEPSQLPVPLDEHNPKHHNFSTNRLLKTWQSVIPNTKDNAILKSKAENLRINLQKSILTYRCWDASKNILYTDVTTVPEDSECMDGMSIHIPQQRTIYEQLGIIHNVLKKN